MIFLVLSVVSVLVCKIGQRSHSQSVRWNEMVSPAEVDEEPSELMQEPLSGQAWAASDSEGAAARSGSCSRLPDFISFFHFRVIQFPRLGRRRGKGTKK